MTLLINVWTSAPDHLKYHCLNRDEGNLIYVALTVTRPHMESEFELLMKILNDCGNDLKKHAVQFSSYKELCEKFVLNDRSSLLDELLKCCLGKDEMAEFRKEIMNLSSVQKRCVSFCRFGDTNALNKMLETYLTDKSSVAHYKAQILTFDNGAEAFRSLLSGNPWNHEIADMEKAREFLSQVFSDASASVKKSVLRSENGRELSEWMVRHSHYSLLELMTSLCLSDDDAREYKKEIMLGSFSQQRCLKLCREEQWREIDEFLGQLLTNTVDVADCKAKILSTVDGVELCTEMKAKDEKITVLFSEMFADASADVKRELIKLNRWRDFCESLIRDSSTTLLDKFVKLLLNDNEAMEFKMQLANLREVQSRYFILLENEKYDELVEYLRYFLPTEDAMMEYNSKIMMAPTAINTLTKTLNLANYVALNDVIDKIIPKRDLSAPVKRTIVLSTQMMVKFQVWIQNGKFAMVKQLVGTLLGNERDADAAKTKLFAYYNEKEMNVIFSTFDESQYQSFLLWVLNKCENVAEYKKSLPLEDIFVKLLQHSVFLKYDKLFSLYKFRTGGCHFEVIDRFLRWYFVTDDAIKEFKMAQIREYSKFDVIQTLKKKERSYLKKLILWFFNNSSSEMLKFKKTNPKCEVLDWI